MNTIPTYAGQFEAEANHFAILDRASQLDPVGFNAGKLATRLQRMEPVGTAEVTELTVAAADVITSGTPEEVAATYRDLEKVFGYYANTPTREVPQEVQDVFRDSGLSNPRPRANVYEYAFAADPNKASHTYTGEERERNLLDIYRGSISAGHKAVRHLVAARHRMRTEGEATEDLEAAEEQVQRMHKEMIRTYRAVTPEFFTLVMTRRFHEVNINGERTQGPNPSHSSFATVDRFAVGSFAEMNKLPHMKAILEHRLTSMPKYMRDMLAAADKAGDNESVLALAQTPQDRKIASNILALVRKDKVAHKSYADKGLVSKGGKLTPGRPDVLTDSIEYVRAAEVR